jgi:anthranilate phosphoribosyltransferase
VRTIFNILGPLTNPAAAKRLMGVFHPDLAASRCARVEAARRRARAGGARDGLDEISLGAATLVGRTA